MVARLATLAGTFCGRVVIVSAFAGCTVTPAHENRARPRAVFNPVTVSWTLPTSGLVRSWSSLIARVAASTVLPSFRIATGRTRKSIRKAPAAIRPAISPASIKRLLFTVRTAGQRADPTVRDRSPRHDGDGVGDRKSVV